MRIWTPRLTDDLYLAILAHHASLVHVPPMTGWQVPVCRNDLHAIPTVTANVERDRGSVGSELRCSGYLIQVSKEGCSLRLKNIPPVMVQAVAAPGSDLVLVPPRGKSCAQEVVAPPHPRASVFLPSIHEGVVQVELLGHG